MLTYRYEPDPLNVIMKLELMNTVYLLTFAQNKEKKERSIVEYYCQRYYVEHITFYILNAFATSSHPHTKKSQPPEQGLAFLPYFQIR